MTITVIMLDNKDPVKNPPFVYGPFESEEIARDWIQGHRQAREQGYKFYIEPLMGTVI